MTILLQPQLNDFAEKDPLWADLQFAESTRYGRKAFLVLPLPSGRLALLGEHKELFAVCDTWAEAVELAPTIPRSIMRRPIEPRSAKVPEADQGEELAKLLGI